MYKIMSPPNINAIYASKETMPASHPFSLCLLSRIRPMAKNNNIMPAKDMYIFNIETDTNLTSNFKNIRYAQRIITYEVTSHH